MSLETFEQVLRFTLRLYDGGKWIMLSGGEPTQHPNLLLMLSRLQGWQVLLLSNGEFLATDLAEPIFASGAIIQITNDSRFYPRAMTVTDPRVFLVDKINMLSPYGRAKENNLPTNRIGPTCFNLRSLMGFHRDFVQAIAMLRLSGKMCCPSIDVHGNLMAGESRFCHRIGSVHDSFARLGSELLSMRCNKCGLEDNLPPAYQRAIRGGKSA